MWGSLFQWKGSASAGEGWQARLGQLEAPREAPRSVCAGSHQGARNNPTTLDPCRDTYWEHLTKVPLVLQPLTHCGGQWELADGHSHRVLSCS